MKNYTRKSNCFSLSWASLAVSWLTLHQQFTFQEIDGFAVFLVLGNERFGAIWVTLRWTSPRWLAQRPSCVTYFGFLWECHELFSVEMCAVLLFSGQCSTVRMCTFLGDVTRIPGCVSWKRHGGAFSGAARAAFKGAARAAFNGRLNSLTDIKQRNETESDTNNNIILIWRLFCIWQRSNVQF